jgi:hypothetical protein
MHQLAERIDWTIKDLFPPKGWLTDGRLMNGIPDLILDTKLFEVKAVKDASRHDEYLSQLFSYFIMSRSSREKRPIIIDEVGIYYARHGVLAKNEIAKIIQSPMTHLKRIAFDFEIEFNYWRNKIHPSQQPDLQMSEKEIEQRRWMSFNEVLDGVWPKPNWLEKALEKKFKRTRQGLIPQQVKIPDNFLIG